MKITIFLAIISFSMSSEYDLVEENIFISKNVIL